MERRNSKKYSLILLAYDLVVLVAIFALAYLIRVKIDDRPLLYEVYASEYILAVSVIIPLWLAIFAILNLYRSDIFRHRLFEYGRIIFGSFLGVLLVVGWEYISEIYVFPARLVTLYVLFGAMASLIIERELNRQFRKYNLRHNRAYERVMLIGGTSTTKNFYEQSLKDTVTGIEVKVFVGPNDLLPKTFTGKSYTKIERMLQDFDPSKIDTVIQVDSSLSEKETKQIFNYAQINHLNYRFLPGNPEFYLGKSSVDILYDYPIISISPTPLTGWGIIVKRVFDLFLVVLSAPIWLPIMLIITILQKIFNPGPVFYSHPRLSQYSKAFNLYKFRSMSSKYGSKDAITEFKEMGRPDLVEEFKRDFKVKNDPRITKFGNFLRKTSLDELPQLFNVLKGDLSLVGPRPITQSELEQKFKSFKKGAIFLSVKSGLTGLWQVSGRNDLSDQERQDLEIYYVRHWSFWLDIKIILRTFVVLIKKTGAR